MKLLKSVYQKLKEMDRRHKTECIIASVLTAVFFGGLPVYAWFSNSKNLKTITKVKEPGEIIIRAGKSDPTAADADPIVNFEMKDIDIESISKGTPGRYVFSVKPGDYNQSYDLILAHTTNIPFTYTLYRAQAVDTSEMSEEEIAALDNNKTLALYTPRDDLSAKTYYGKNGSVTMKVLNPDDGAYGRTIADSSDQYRCYDYTYDSTDQPQIYAVPLYSVTSDPIVHPENAADAYDYFILELAWDESADISSDSAYADWNKAKNNKETDMIYITAHKHLG